MRRVAVERSVELTLYDPYPAGREVVLFVHGWPMSHKVFDSTVLRLCEEGYRPISYDLRGFGGSDQPAEGYDYNRMADDLRRIVDAIGEKRITLVGHGMGAAIIARYMNRQGGHRIGKIVMIAPACPQVVEDDLSPWGVARDRMEKGIVLALRDRPALVEEVVRQMVSDDASEAFVSWACHCALEASDLAVVQSLHALYTEDVRVDLRTVRVPVMILHGKRDPLSPFAFARETCSLLPHAFVVPFEKSGHCPFWDEPVFLCDKLIDFLTGRYYLPR